jgi:hypothetical protein
VTEKARGELGVEQATRDRPARLLEHLEILVCGVRHADTGTIEHLSQRP